MSPWKPDCAKIILVVCNKITVKFGLSWKFQLILVLCDVKYLHCSCGPRPPPPPSSSSSSSSWSSASSWPADSHESKASTKPAVSASADDWQDKLLLCVSLRLRPSVHQRASAVPVCTLAEQQQKVHRSVRAGQSSGSGYRSAAGKAKQCCWSSQMQVCCSAPLLSPGQFFVLTFIRSHIWNCFEKWILRIRYCWWNIPVFSLKVQIWLLQFV